MCYLKTSWTLNLITSRTLSITPRARTCATTKGYSPAVIVALSAALITQRAIGAIPLSELGFALLALVVVVVMLGAASIS